MSGRIESADNASSNVGSAQPDDQPPRGVQGVFTCGEGQLREIRNERPPPCIFRVSPEFLEIKPAVVADHIDASAAVAAFEALHVRQMITFPDLSNVASPANLVRPLPLSWTIARGREVIQRLVPFYSLRGPVAGTRPARPIRKRRAV